MGDAKAAGSSTVSAVIACPARCGRLAAVGPWRLASVLARRAVAAAHLVGHALAVAAASCHNPLAAMELRPQLPDSLCMWRLAEELDEAVRGLAVERVVPLSQSAAVMELRPAARAVYLCWQAGLGRVRLCSSAELPAAPVAAAFADWLRRLRGAVVAAVEQINFDRVCAIEFANFEGLGPESRVRLVLEATGRMANCLLVGADGRVIAAAHRWKGSKRSIAIGEQYQPPPIGGRVDPRGAGPEHFADALEAGKDLARCLRAHFQGMSDVLIAELCARAGLDPAAQAGESAEGAAEALAAAMACIVEEAEAGRAWLYRDESGLPVLCYPVRLSCMQREPEAIESLSAGVEVVGRRLDEAARAEQLAGQLRRAVKAAAERLARTIAARERELAAASEAEKFRRWAELLLAWAASLRGRTGPGEVEVPDFYASGSTARIPLLPGKDAVATAQEYFERHRKAKRRAERLPALIEEDRRRLAWLEELAEQIELAAGDAEALEEIAQTLDRAGLLEARRAAHRRQRQPSGLRQFTSPEGYTVLCGRTAAANDQLVRIARPDDIWLHARGVPGAHVLIRTDGRPDAVPRSTLLFAARLAARFSRQRSEKIGEVDYTLAKYVRKPRGAPEGFVIYTHEKTLRVELEDE